jgi:3-oxoacyl-[acyl-carrier protein] reductase
MTSSRPAEVRDRVCEQIPLGRLGRPEDVAGIAAFLASEQAGYITGQVIRVNGGLYM